MSKKRGFYKQYTINESERIPRRTEYRKRKRLLAEVDEQRQIITGISQERSLEQDEVCQQ